MKFLAIDTSGKHLTVIAYNGEKAFTVYEENCALRHSVVLMDKIDEALRGAEISATDCDFFAVTVGPGSFTGIRIGIATVKGLCFACGKPALGVTSFDCIAYAEKRERVLALVDAGHGYVYSCAYEGEQIVQPPRYCSGEEAESLREQFEIVSAESVPVAAATVNPAAGLLNAALGKADRTVPAEDLVALYIRKSSAEEKR